MKSKSCPPDVTSCNLVLKACLNSRQWAPATELLSSMEADFGVAPDLVSFNTTLSTLARGGQWAKAKKLVESMSNPGPDVVSFGAALHACSIGGHWGSALELLDTMEQRGVKPNTISFNSAITACANGGAWVVALEMLDAMLEESKLVGNTIAPAKGSSNSTSSSSSNSSSSEKKTFQQRRQEYYHRASRSHRMRPDVISFSATITACARSGRWREALVVLESMPHFGVKPNVVVLNSALGALAIGKQWQAVLELFASMEPRYGVAPNQVSYAAAIHACAQPPPPAAAAGRARSSSVWGGKNIKTHGGGGGGGHTAVVGVPGWERALSLLETMQTTHGLSPDVVTLTSAMAACVQGGRWPFALEVFDGLLAGTWRQQHRTVVGVNGGDTRGKGSSGKGNGSSGGATTTTTTTSAVLTTPAGAAVRPDTACFNAALAACEKGGQGGRSLEILELMEADARKHTLALAFKLAIGACGNGGSGELALACFESMADRGVKPSEEHFCALVVALDSATAANATTTTAAYSRPEDTAAAARVLQRRSGDTTTTITTRASPTPTLSTMVDLVNSARSQGLFPKVFQSSDYSLDYSGLPSPVCAAMVGLILRDLRDGARPSCDLRITTGLAPPLQRGFESAVLPLPVRTLLQDTGLLATEIPGEPGAFLLRQDDIWRWLGGMGLGGKLGQR